MIDERIVRPTRFEQLGIAAGAKSRASTLPTDTSTICARLVCVTDAQSDVAFVSSFLNEDRRSHRLFKCKATVLFANEDIRVRGIRLIR